MKTKMYIILLVALFLPSYGMEKSKKKRKKNNKTIIKLVKEKSLRTINRHLEKHPKDASVEDKNGNNLVQIALHAKRSPEIITMLLPHVNLTKGNNEGNDIAETVISFGKSQREKYVPIISEEYLKNMHEETRNLAEQLALLITTKYHADYSWAMSYLDLQHSLVCEPEHQCSL